MENKEKKNTKIRSKKKSTISKWITRLVMVIAVCVFIYSAYNIFIIKKANSDEAQEVESVREDIQADKVKDWSKFRVDFSKLDKYPDVVGWIVVEDTDISYPVVKGKDNDYYLNHTYTGASNYAGAIFMDYRANPYLQDYNTFVYGHNVQHQTMFAKLSKYMDKSFFDAHPNVYYYTREGSYKLQVYSAYEEKGDSASYRMEYTGPEDYASYLNFVKGLSKFQNDVTMDANDHMMTLYTCSKVGASAEYAEDRYFIHLKVVEALEGDMPYGEPVK